MLNVHKQRLFEKRNRKKKEGKSIYRLKYLVHMVMIYNLVVHKAKGFQSNYHLEFNLKMRKFLKW